MPFTPSHAVVALPFVGRPLSRTGLVPAAIAVGAMAPDLPLFVRGTPLSYAITHDLRWLPVTVLVALVLLLVWRCVLRPAARELSPEWLAGRLPGSWGAGARASLRETLSAGRGGARVLLLIAALALGVVSHVVWDAFTHEGRAGTVLIPALGDAWGPLPGYTWVQHGSSVAGLVLLAGAAIVWLHRRAPAPVHRVFPGWVRVAWWLSLPVLLVAVGLAFLPFGLPFAAEQLAYRVLPPLCAAWGAATALLCLVVQARSRPRPA